MNHYRTAVFLGFFVAVAAPALPAFSQTCTPKHKFSTVEEGYITVSAATYAPYSMIDEGGNATGIDGDILHAIAELECLKVRTVPVDAAAAIQYVLSKKSDTAAGDWFRTAERAKVLGLSEPLYLDQMAIYSKEGWSNVSDLEGKTVGALQGSLWDADLKAILGDGLKLYPTAVGMAQDLTSGRISAFVEGAAFGAIAKTKGEIKDIKIVPAIPDERVKASVGAGQGCFVIAKDNPDMLRAFDEDVKALKERGITKKLLVKYGLPDSAAETGAPFLIE